MARKIAFILAIFSAASQLGSAWMRYVIDCAVCLGSPEEYALVCPLLTIEYYERLGGPNVPAYTTSISNFGVFGSMRGVAVVTKESLVGPF